MGIQRRSNANAVLALALIHHLCIGRNALISEVIQWIVSLAPSGVIEFVPKTDSMVAELLRFREDIFPDYNEQEFQNAIESNARVIKQQQVTESGRQLI